MQELMNMVAELTEYLNARERELSNNTNFNTHVQGELNNRRQEIENFKVASMSQIHPTLINETIKNFRIEKEKIKLKINKIQC